MPVLFIRACNADFRSRDDGAEYQDAKAALAVGVQTAATMAADEIVKGKTNAAVEIIVEQSNGVELLRSVVSISVSPLLITDKSI